VKKEKVWINMPSKNDNYKMIKMTDDDDPEKGAAVWEIRKNLERPKAGSGTFGRVTDFLEELELVD